MPNETQTATDGATLPTIDAPSTGTAPVSQPATSPSSAVPQPVPPVSQKATGLNPDVYASDGKRWSDKFYGAQGALKQVQEQAAQATGGLEQQILQLTQAVQERDATIASIMKQRDGAMEQASTIPDLQKQIETLSSEAARAEKYRLFWEFPSVASMRVERTVEPEDGGEAQTVVTNPVLELIETSTMPLDQLRATLQQFVTALPQKAASTAEQRPSASTPSTPTPAMPTSPSVDDAWARVVAAQEKYQSDPSPEADREHQEAWEAYYASQGVPNLS